MQTIDDDTYPLLTIWIGILALVSTLSGKHLYDYSVRYTGYQERNILHTPYNSELRVLACVHRPDDALASINLLQASSPCREAPIAAYALYLTELVGRTAPLLINHKLGQKSSTGSSKSQLVVDVFQHFENQYIGLVTVQVFTSMSLTKFMHYDVCSLAFDKLVAVIILPYHRKWNQMGKVIFDSSVHRLMNKEVLDLAPCSVGILVDRRKIRPETNVEPGHSQYEVVVIFLGGDDDREALAYAKRMARSQVVHLRVVRLIDANESKENLWDSVLDNESLREIKAASSSQHNVDYREHIVKDGPETVAVINAVEEDALDLIIVGRRHKDDMPMLLGLSEWCDVPELGAIGDVLASTDVKRPVSVLVVQRQVVKSNRES